MSTSTEQEGTGDGTEIRLRKMVALTKPGDGRETAARKEGRCDIRGEAFEIRAVAADGLAADRLFTPGLAGLPSTLADIGELLSEADITAFEQLVGRTRVGASGLEFFTGLVMRAANLETGRQPGEWFVPLRNGGSVSDMALRDYTRQELGGPKASTGLVLIASSLATSLLNAYRPGLVQPVFLRSEGASRTGAYAVGRARYRIARPDDILREYRRIWVQNQLTSAAIATGAASAAKRLGEKNAAVLQRVEGWMEGIAKGQAATGTDKKTDPISPEILLRMIHLALSGLQSALRKPRNARANIVLATQLLFGDWVDGLAPALSSNKSAIDIIAQVSPCVTFRRWAVSAYARSGLAPRAVDERDLEDTAAFLRDVFAAAQSGGRLTISKGRDLRKKTNAVAMRSVQRQDEYSALGVATPVCGADSTTSSVAALMTPTSEKEFVCGAPEERTAAAVRDHRLAWLTLCGAATATGDLGAVDMASAGGTGIILAGRPHELELIAFDGCEMHLERTSAGAGWTLRAEMPSNFDYTKDRSGPLDAAVLRRFCTPAVSDPSQGHYGRWRTPSTAIAGALVCFETLPEDKVVDAGAALVTRAETVDLQVDTQAVVAGATLHATLLGPSTWLGMREAVGREAHPSFRISAPMPKAHPNDPTRILEARFSIPKMIGDIEWKLAPYVFANPATEREFGTAWLVSRLVSACEPYSGLTSGREHVYLPHLARAIIDTRAIHRAIPLVVRGTRRPFTPSYPPDAVAAVLIAWHLFVETSRALAVLPKALADSFQFPATGKLAAKLALENTEIKAILEANKGLRAVA